MEHQAPNPQSKFNYASDILQRVGYSQFNASEFYRKGELDSWFFELKNIFYQLAGKFDASEQKELRKIEKKINLFIGKERNERINKILSALIESYLLCLQNKIESKGMGLVDKEDDTHFA